MKMKMTGDEREKAATKSLAPCALDEIDEEANQHLQEPLGTTVERLLPCGRWNVNTISTSAITRNMVNIELVTGIGPTLKSSSAAREM